ncbi:MAG: hypothetical protein P1U47_13040 [Zhongshania sp.]|uniref:hypothetical protein n=1 Tax=Zhongshania sp. TaxID=1971902 RepID=UPI00261773F7|nr:hypothetical protein [Zhongshania sp.]MDF1693288.1 hypothetical protein [Zhongshania sp.]MDF1693299.1 hypothetical protein [Zhongshania sp.]
MRSIISIFLFFFASSAFAGYKWVHDNSTGVCAENPEQACYTVTLAKIWTGTRCAQDVGGQPSQYSWIFTSCLYVPPPADDCAAKSGVSVWTSVDQAPLIKDADDCLAECSLVVDFDSSTPSTRCTYTGTVADLDENDNIIPPNDYPDETSPEHCEVDNNAGVCLDSNHPDNSVNGDGSPAEGCPDNRPQYGKIALNGKTYNVCVASGGGGEGITYTQDPNKPVNTGGAGTEAPANSGDSGTGGAGPAAPQTGNTGGGSSDPSTSGELGENDFYEAGQTGNGQDLTYSNILTNFQFRVSESAVGSSWKNFFNVSITGSCPSYALSTWIFNITFDQWCSAMMPWGLISGVLMACALFMAGRIAFT